MINNKEILEILNGLEEAKDIEPGRAFIIDSPLGNEIVVTSEEANNIKKSLLKLKGIIEKDGNLLEHIEILEELTGFKFPKAN